MISAEQIQQARDTFNKAREAATDDTWIMASVEDLRVLLDGLESLQFSNEMLLARIQQLEAPPTTLTATSVPSQPEGTKRIEYRVVCSRWRTGAYDLLSSAVDHIARVRQDLPGDYDDMRIESREVIEGQWHPVHREGET